ncbi:CsgG/HfaB family protein [Methylobacterium symbioticum]|uniref:Curli production assembly/transport component CsgG n=1 Tax=Methylobacterium symbioticum TaxID=2584084 RepID=A0A509ECF7_9HYPH|nr:CsgG/HfaB family protein [Methylobacterium symbioticum]VUD71149.1 Curli production assembly/transport component CsgG [Methylobacterium symbioticum]
MLNVVKHTAAAGLLSCALSACIATTGSVLDPATQPATLVPLTKTGVILDKLPPPVQPLDVAVYSFPDLTGQNKPNDNFAEFSRATTQGGAPILMDVLVKAGGGRWFNVVERNELASLLQERQIIQNTRTAVEGPKAKGLPPLRFAGIALQGGIVGYDSNETTGGIGANYLGIGANTQYRQDIVTVALRAVSVQTGRVMASVTTTKTIYSVLVNGTVFRFAAVDQLLQAEAGFTKNSPTTLAVREGIQLAVYSLIFEGARNRLWRFKDAEAGEAFLRALDEQRRAVDFTIGPADAPEAAAPAGTVVVAKS